ncbi:YraN family protein [Ascidiimonas sp. W6]|uniref:YraN family protein n=1 Tax=Ascidiimonas meishanensis TaxID=3128903 RepID=UPI0030EBE738
MAEHNEFGKIAEEMACVHLQKKGYEVLERNFFYDRAEVDIIAKKEDLIVCVEVKARSSSDFGNPQDFISQKKIKLLVKAMNEYVNRLEIEVEVRFDVVAIVKSRSNFSIEHLENAFYHF